MPFSRRTGIAAAVLSLFLLPGCGRKPEPPEESPARDRPSRPKANVLLVTIDTLRADHLSCYGSKAVATPAIDAVAARGVRFERAFSQVPLTPPSHASILTGAYPQVHQVRDMGGFTLDPDVPTLATVLKDAGYDTAAFVGAAVLNRHYAMDRGFDTYGDEMQDLPENEKIPGVVAEVRGEQVTGRAIDWLGKHLEASPNRRFFLWVHYYDPHFPYDPPEPYRTRHRTDLYAGEIAYTDAQVGKLVDWLAQRRVLENTLVVLMSDHGESLGEHGEYTHGVFLYDSTMHIPLIIAGPGLPAGAVVSPQVRSIDVMPTVADHAGVPAGKSAQGVSLLPAMVEGKGVRANYCYMETLYPKSTMAWSELRGMRTDEWKLIIAPKPELYRMARDAGETENVVQRFPADAERLQKKVWEIAGAPEQLGELRPAPIDEARRRELESLGYVGAGQRALKIDMSGPDPKDRVEILGVIERATEFMNHDRFNEAAALLEKIVSLDATNPMLYKKLGLSYQRLGRFEQAEKVYLEAVKNKADEDQTHAELGNIYIRRGDLTRAVDAMERAARMNPANLQNMVNLATAYLHLDKPEETRRVLNAILAQNAGYAAAHNLFGILEIRRGRGAEAREHFEKAVKGNPDLTEAYMNLGLLAQNAGDSKAAIGYYKRFLRLAKPDKYGEIIPKVKAAIKDLESGM